jgi:hypothetical protein
LKTLLGEEFTTAINGRYLKKYYPSIEVDRWLQAPDYKDKKYRNSRRSEKEPPLEQKS